LATQFAHRRPIAPADRRWRKSCHGDVITLVVVAAAR
jgi:hypothetical protein